MKIDAVCFDMDGTLIRNTNSVRYLCMLAGKKKEFDEIECLEDDGSVTWIEGDFLKAKLIKGLDIAELEKNFDNYIRLIRNLDMVMRYLKDRNIKSVLITAG
ncbi:MAG: haloacid dehalogenase, partial [candidate division Zixibacteria bacterium]|nr:haloacid dehalogenase [candidate division Zixibacteria bacterium]